MKGQCKFSGCNKQIHWAAKYCPDHEKIELICDTCGITFIRDRVTQEGIERTAIKRAETNNTTYFPSCSRACASKHSRNFIDKEAYEYKQPPIEPLWLTFENSEHKVFIQKKKGKEKMPMWQLFKPDPDDEKLHNCTSLSAGTLILAPEELEAIKSRVNDPEYKRPARWTFSKWDFRTTW